MAALNSCAAQFNRMFQTSHYNSNSVNVSAFNGSGVILFEKKKGAPDSCNNYVFVQLFFYPAQFRIIDRLDCIMHVLRARPEIKQALACVFLLKAAMLEVSLRPTVFT